MSRKWLVPGPRRRAGSEGTGVLRKIAKDRRDDLPPKGKDLLQAPPHKECIDQIAENAEGYQVMHQVRHLDATLNIPKMMLMMPKLIGTPPLLVDKIMPLLHLRVLGKPIASQPWQRPELIFDELTGINARPG